MGKLKWTFEACKLEALKYNTRKDFKVNSGSAYTTSCRNKWLDIICSHMTRPTNSSRKWYFESCRDEALKYKARNLFAKGSKGAYKVANEEKFLDEICKHMVTYSKPKGYWNKKRCHTVALKCETRSEFFKKYGSAANKALKEGFLEEICSHMAIILRPKSYWTKEICLKEAMKYNYRNDFKKYSPNIYSISIKKGWYEEICSHMVEVTNKPKYYWTKELCKEEALKYKTSLDFVKNSGGCYAASSRNGYLDEICSHFQIKGSRYMRFVYAYEFPDNHVYVGLTYNIKERKMRHLKKGSVFNYSEFTKLIPIFKKLTDIPVEVEEAKKLEYIYLQQYIKEGWIKLNRAKTGGIGGNVFKWGYDKCLLEAKKYKYRSDFKKGSAGAFDSARRLGFLDEVCSHMTKRKSTKRVFILEECIEIAMRYDTYRDFRVGESNIHGVVCKNKWNTIIKNIFSKNTNIES